MNDPQILSGESGSPGSPRPDSREALFAQLLDLATPDERLPSHAPAPATPGVIDPQIKQQAIEWLVSLDSPEHIYERWRGFQAWLKERPEHREMYLWVERTWHEAGILVAQQSAADCKGVLDTRRRWQEISGKKRRRVWIIRGAKVAIGCTLLLMAFGLFALFGPTVQTEKEFAPEYGKRTTFALPDHSIVTLDINSRLRARLGLLKRELVLERGEGFFHVEKERARAFLVQANGTIFRAMGTEFSVDLRRDGKVVAAVAQGQVAVTPGSLVSSQPAEPSQPHELRISAGDQVTVDVMGRVQTEHPGVLAIQRQTLWKDGLISLDRRPLSEWVAAFNTYNSRKLQIIDASIADIPISGVFKDSDPDTFVQAVRDAYGIRSTVKSSPSEPGTTVIELRAAIDTRGRK